jgi:hypothetical protein
MSYYIIMTVGMVLLFIPPPYFANVSIILLACRESFLANLAILTHSVMFVLFNLLYTPSAIRRAIFLSTPFFYPRRLQQYQQTLLLYMV